MKKILLSLCLLQFMLSAAAQPNLPADSATSAALPLSQSEPFYGYNMLSKLRLDSIEATVPLSYNEFVQNYIDIYTERKGMFGKMLGLGQHYFPVFEKALKAYNIPEEIKYLPIIESAMDPQAVSKSGATGLWQFMFTTAKGYGLNIDNFEDQRKDPIQASYAAAAYFRDAYNVLGDWLLALAAYNCGQGNVKRAIEKADSRDFWEIRRFLPVQTQNYVPAFIAAVYTMKYADEHDIALQESTFKAPIDTILVNRFVALSDLATAMHVPAEVLTDLNPSYKRKIANGTEEKAKRIVLPHISVADYSTVYEVLNDSHPTTGRQIILTVNDSKERAKKAEKPAKSKSPKIHKVTKGQTLSEIADRYRITLQDLKVWNKLKSDVIVPGQRLKVTNGS